MVSLSEIIALRNKGLNDTEVAKVLGITKQGVSWHLRRAGVKTLSERVREYMPWEITGPQVKTNPYRQLRLHLEYREAGVSGISEGDRQRLRDLYRRLEEFSVVVRFDPDIPPYPGQKYGGFEFVPREESDGDLILRVDKHTKIPADGRERWSLPAREDWPE